jgi:hypothetical protein
MSFNSIYSSHSPLIKDAVLSGGIGYLATWGLTAVHPIVGALYCFNLEVIHHGLNSYFHNEKASSLHYLVRTIVEMVASMGLTTKLCQLYGTSIGLKESLVTLGVCTVVLLTGGTIVGIAKRALFPLKMDFQLDNADFNELYDRF